MPGGGSYLRFWGVRGSIAAPGPETAKYGGNTSCIEVRCNGHLIILDGGTGIRALGNSLAPENGSIDADLLLTHTHFDHVSGIPFFKPFYIAGNTFRLSAGHLLPAHTLREVLCELMMAPLFPVPIEIMGSDVSFQDFEVGEEFTLKCGAHVMTRPLNHPNGATGYRLTIGDKSMAYVTDTEHKDGELDANILELIKDTDYFIYDSNYTPEEYPTYKGWGHSTWGAGADLADAAGVGTFIVFHHDPSHDDAFMDGVAAEVEKRRPGSVVAREGLTLRLD